MIFGHYGQFVYHSFENFIHYRGIPKSSYLQEQELKIANTSNPIKANLDVNDIANDHNPHFKYLKSLPNWGSPLIHYALNDAKTLISPWERWRCIAGNIALYVIQQSVYLFAIIAAAKMGTHLKWSVLVGGYIGIAAGLGLGISSSLIGFRTRNLSYNSPFEWWVETSFDEKLVADGEIRACMKPEARRAHYINAVAKPLLIAILYSGAASFFARYPFPTSVLLSLSSRTKIYIDETFWNIGWVSANAVGSFITFKLTYPIAEVISKKIIQIVARQFTH